MHPSMARPSSFDSEPTSLRAVFVNRKVPAPRVSLIRPLSRTERSETVRNPFFGRVPLRPLNEEPAAWRPQRNGASRTKRRGAREGGGRCWPTTTTIYERKGTEPVFERSGESAGYTFTDLHYPRFVSLFRPFLLRILASLLLLTD